MWYNKFYILVYVIYKLWLNWYKWMVYITPSWVTALYRRDLFTQWSYEPCRAGPPKDGSQWRVLTRCGPSEEAVANRSSILLLLLHWLHENLWLCGSQQTMGNYLKRWKYHITLPVSWVMCMQVNKQQLESYMEQLTGSKLGKEYEKAVYRHPVYITYMQSVQFSCLVVSDSLRPHGLQHARPPCPSWTTGACSNSCWSSWWCHPTISSSVIPSPPVFNLYAEYIMQNASLDKSQAGIKIARRNINNLR